MPKAVEDDYSDDGDNDEDDGGGLASLFGNLVSSLPNGEWAYTANSVAWDSHTESHHHIMHMSLETCASGEPSTWQIYSKNIKQQRPRECC